MAMFDYIDFSALYLASRIQNKKNCFIELSFQAASHTHFPCARRHISDPHWLKSRVFCQFSTLIHNLLVQHKTVYEKKYSLYYLFTIYFQFIYAQSMWDRRIKALGTRHNELVSGVNFSCRGERDESQFSPQFQLGTSHS